MHLSRNRELWACCLQPFELHEEPAPIYVMNQNLLTSYASSSHSESRPASPLSDSDLEVDGDGVQNIQSGENHSNFEFDVRCPPDQLQYRRPTSPHSVTLSTDFNINTEANKRIPYPTDAEERKMWTDDQRAKTSQAQIPQDMNDFARIVRRTQMFLGVRLM
jgi:hypothetical protein